MFLFSFDYMSESLTNIMSFINDDYYCAQSVGVSLFLWNNSGTPFRDDRIAWQVDSSLNRFCWPRWLAASLAATEFVCVMDDDLIPVDDDVFRDALSWLATHGDRDTIIGPQGLVLDRTKTYREGAHVNAHKERWDKRRRRVLAKVEERKPTTGAALPSAAERVAGAAGGTAAAAEAAVDDAEAAEEAALQMIEEKTTSVAVDVIKGRMMIMRLASLRAKAGFLFSCNDRRGDDIAISASLGDGRTRHHRVLQLFQNRVAELPAPHALCAGEGGADHYALREKVRRRFFQD